MPATNASSKKIAGKLKASQSKSHKNLNHANLAENEQGRATTPDAADDDDSLNLANPTSLSKRKPKARSQRAPLPSPPDSRHGGTEGGLFASTSSADDDVRGV